MSRRSRRAIGVLLALGTTAGCGGGAEAGRGDHGAAASGAGPARQRATVVSIVDGDTVRLRGVGVGPLAAGEVSRVRLLEIDSPESGDCGYADATARLAGLMPPRSTVTVAPDRDPIDRFGRHLLYVFAADGRMINLVMVEQGFARAVLFEPNDAHIGAMRAAQRDAEAARRGLWRTCGSAG